MLMSRAARSLVLFSLAILHTPDLDGGRTTFAHQAPAPTLMPRGIDFVENRGQWDSPARFAAWLGRDLAVSLEPGGVALSLEGKSTSFVRLRFEGASTGAAVVGEEKRAAVYNFFVGNDQRRWQTNVPAFGSVRYRGVYEGVDIRVLQRGDRLEDDVLLQPYADLEQVIGRAAGATGLEIAADGALMIQTAAGPLRQTAPVTWEELPDGTTRRLESRFRRIDAERYGTPITLSVTNGRDAIWSGACSSGGNKQRTCTLTLSGNASVAANVQ